MRLYKYLQNPIMALCLAGLLSCSDDKDIINNDNQEATTYISLIINAPSQTRSNAYIDGEEEGIRHENEIKNLSLFFYHAGDKGLDMPDDTELVGSLYIDDLNLELVDGAAATKAYPLNGFIPTVGDKIIAIANMGDITALNRLADVRDYLVENTYKYASSIPLYSEFTMANALNTDDDGKVEVISETGTKLGSKENPYTATVTLERTAARIDFAFVDTYYNESKSEVVFPVRNSVNATIARTHITHVLPVNAMQKPAYLIRRVSSSATSLQDVKYCGDETGSNYVIEPTTLLKATSAGIDINNWYGTTRASYFRDSYTGIFTTSNSLASLLSAEAPQSFSSANTNDNRYVTIDYVNENTQSETLNDSRFLTGLAIRAIYEPETVYTDGDATIVDADDYSTGRTFWRYSPSRQDFAEEQCFYFNNQAAAETYRANHPEDVAEITCYEGGICYYNMWIHHTPTVASDPQETYPMDYAIVRNNIYRVSVSFTGSGDPKPDMREPNNIQSRVFVRAWNFRQQPTIIM
ncbi:MAG: Mfa1 family fimbria major subunit [Candidatus Limisoma sp.]